MHVQKISFHNRHREKLVGVITFPGDPGSTEPAPAILLCQGLSGVKNLVLPEVAEAFAGEGWISLAFDYSGYGESEGEKGWVDPFRRVDDAWFAYTFLISHPLVLRHQTALYGLSYGGPVAISLLPKEPGIRAAVAVSPPGSGEMLMRQLRDEDQWTRFSEEVKNARIQLAVSGSPSLTDILHLFPFHSRFLEKYRKLGSSGQSSAMEQSEPTKPEFFHWSSADLILAFHPEEEVRRKGSIPLLLVSGEADDIATPGQVMLLEANAPEPKEWVLIPGLDHVDLDTGDGLLQQIRLSIEWFRKYLATGA